MNANAIELSFYWLFVFIVGAVILGFFFVVANRALKFSEERSVIDFSRNFDSFLISMLQSSNFEKHFFFSNDVGFRCNPSFCEFLVKDKGTAFKDKIIFAPDKVSGDVLFVTKSVDVPFRVANVVYLFSDKKYYFVFDDSSSSARLKEVLMDVLPDGLDHDFVGVDDVGKISDFSNVKLVFLNTKIPSLPDASRKYVFSASLIGDNFVEFYVKEKDSVYLKKVSNQIVVSFDSSKMFLGAVVSDSPELFNNQLLEIVERINSVSLVYLNRLNDLPGDCGGFYAEAKSLFEKYVSESGKNSVFLNLPFNDLVSLNNNIVRNSCPEVF